jgi:hypothetical protein
MHPTLKKIHYHTRTGGVVSSSVLDPLYVDITFVSSRATSNSKPPGVLANSCFNNTAMVLQPLHGTPSPLDPSERAALLPTLMQSVPGSSESDFGVISRGAADLIAEWTNSDRALSTLNVNTDVLVRHSYLYQCRRRTWPMLTHLVCSHWSAQMDVETRATCFVSVAPVAAEGQEQPDFCVRVYQPRVLVPAEDQVCGQSTPVSSIVVGRTSRTATPLTRWEQ